jgi:hypothetical protein
MRITFAGWLLGIGASLVWPACGIDVLDIELVETGQAGGLAISFPGFGNFGTSLGQALSSKDVDPADVDSMKLTAVQFTLTSQGGLTDDLTFLRSLAFVVSADGLAGQELASHSPFSAGERTVAFEVRSELELKPFLEAGGLRIEIEADLAYPPPDVVDLEVTFRLRVDVNVI